MNTNNEKQTTTFFVTPAARIAFPALFKMKPRYSKVKAGEEVKMAYQCTLLFPPGTDFKPFLAAAKAAMVATWDEVKPFDALEHFPLKKCDDKPNPPRGYDPGWVELATNNTRRVVVTDRRGNVVTDEEAVYGGMWVRANLNAWAWKSGDGISFGLNGIQIIRDDEPFAGVNPSAIVSSFGDLGDLTDDEAAVRPMNTGKPADLPKTKPPKPKHNFDFEL